jgi:hypothetical protein
VTLHFKYLRPRHQLPPLVPGSDALHMAAGAAEDSVSVPSVEMIDIKSW